MATKKKSVGIKARKQAVARAFIQAGEDIKSELNKPTPSLLHRADDIINGDRQKDYGDKLQNFSQISMLWQGTLATKLAPGQFITAEDVALCMIQVKIARLAKSPDHADSILDVAGYAGCYDKIQEERIFGDMLQGATQDFREGDMFMKPD